ncbi:MAG: NUDIX domain-containing protein [Ignavibacteria bacterium]|nr:NUDIX domain-containing protein [Ignavibacteria bacterium]MCC7159589.1 NUDIX domain-containing protein [Ignavibacteria bacterium]
MTEPGSNEIRPLVICVFRYENKFLAALGTDTVKKNEFYRPLGGRIEFGERSEDALRREIMEELGQQIINVKYLGTLENVFSYNGKSCHELVLVYDGEFINKELYEMTEIDVDEENIWYKAHWISVEDCESGKVTVYPEGLLELLS